MAWEELIYRYALEQFRHKVGIVFLFLSGNVMKKYHKSLLLKVVLCAVVSFASLPAYAEDVVNDDNIGTEAVPDPDHPGFVAEELSNTITNNANVYVVGRALYLTTATSGSNTITNNGVAYSSTDFAVQGSGGNDTLTNNSSGTIYGGNGIDLGGGDDTFNNSGILGVMDRVDGGIGEDTLNLSGTASRTFNGDFLNFEYLNKDGTGSWILGGNVTLDSESGPLPIVTTTTVNAGALLINGTLDSDTVTVYDGATLGGIGEITGDVGIGTTGSGPGGTIAPGGSVGTLTIIGDFESDAFTTFDVEMDASAADLVAVTGTATVNGGTVSVTPTGVIQNGDTRNILTAGTLVGGFTSLTDSSRVLSFTIVNDILTGEVQLTASRATYASVMSSALAPISRAIDAAIPSATGDLAACITSMDASSNPEPALKELSPETHGNTSNVGRDVLNLYMRTFVNRMQSLRVANSSVSGEDTRVAANLTDSGPVLADIASVVSYRYKNWSAWLEFFGQIGYQSNKNGRLGYSYNAYGPALGMDTRLSDNVIVGLSTGYARTNVDTNSINSSTDVDAFNLTAYGTYYKTKEYYLDAAFTYGWDWYDSKRTVAGLGELTSDHEGHELSVYGGGGYYLDNLIGLDRISIIPIASIQYGQHGEDSFTETVNGVAFTNIDRIDSDSLVSRVGLILEHLFKIKTVDVLANISGQWGHEYLDTQNTVSARFAESSASAFDTGGLEADRDSFLFGAGSVASLAENLDLSFDYNMDLRDTFYAHNFALRARAKW